jgi:hypothetical protein
MTFAVENLHYFEERMDRFGKEDDHYS